LETSNEHSSANVLAAALSAVLLATLIAPAWATEGGGSHYPNGAENFAAGAMPPPGTYGMVFAEHYNADRVNDADGNSLHVPGFEVTANAVVPRFIWVTGATVLGGSLSWHVLAPLVDLKVSEARPPRPEPQDAGPTTPRYRPSTRHADTRLELHELALAIYAVGAIDPGHEPVSRG